MAHDFILHDLTIRDAPQPSAAVEYATAFRDISERLVTAESDGVPIAATRILDVRLRETAGLTSTLGLISKFFDDHVCLEAYQGKGLQIRTVDQAKCSFLDAYFPATSAQSLTSAFSRFDCDRPYFPMWIAPAVLGRAIRTATEGRKRATSCRPFVLHLGVAASDPDCLIVEAETTAGSGQRSTCITKVTRHELALLTPLSDASSCFVDGESFCFSAEALVDSPDLLAEILSDVKSSGCEEVRLELHASRLQLSGKAGDNCSKLQVSLRGSSHPGAGGLCINVPDKPVMANFKVNHLQCLAHLCGDSVCVLLQMGEEAPLSATFQLVGGGACQIFIAPCLEDEVDGNVEDGHY